jgi:hypothetical protein
MKPDFVFEYEFNPSPDAEERLAQALDLILTLILEDIETEQDETKKMGDDLC